MKEGDKFGRGLVPWPIDDFLEVYQWYLKLHNTPKDDWDLKERGFLMETAEGQVAQIELNMFTPMNQIGMYMTARYRDNKNGKHYIFRFIQMTTFLGEHLEELERDGFVRKDSAGTPEIARPIFEALCVLPYSQVTRTKRGTERSFDYPEVLKKAKELSADGGDGEPGTGPT
jgi:hypothetical protein